MRTHFEESLQRDIDRIRGKVVEMAALGERALRDCVKALQGRNRQFAYMVILRDQNIDDLDKEIDRLCLEFLVRQQPVAGPLRFVYATIRINMELERVGDYAESIARQVLKLVGMDAQIPLPRFVEIADLAVPMLRDAVRAFVEQNPELAKATMQVEETVDTLRNQISEELYQLRQDNKIPLAALTPLMTIARRFERVSDQAKNICQEVVYMTTGEYAKHKTGDVYRVLFVDEHNSCLSLLAEAIGNSINQPRFVFASAGLDPKPIDAATVGFMRAKGMDISRRVPKTLAHVPHLDHYQIMVNLLPGGQAAPPQLSRKAVCLDWNVSDPSRLIGTPAEIHAAYETTHHTLQSNIKDLVAAIVGDTQPKRKQP